MSNTDPQLEFNFASLRPFDEVPRRKSQIKQSAIQVEGSFVRGDAHPEFDGLFYRSCHGGVQYWAPLESIERGRARSLKWSRENSELSIAAARKWNVANPKRVLASRRRHYQNNKEKYFAKNALRRTVEKENINLHETAQKALQAIYKLRETLTLCSKGSGSTEAFHVDHIWPLNHEKFCGLHAPWNLQILEASENRRKSNKPPLPC